MRIKRPPTYSDDEAHNSLLKLIMMPSEEFGSLGFSSTGEYLSYYDLVNRGGDAKSLWPAIHTLRLSQAKKLPFVDKSGNQGTFQITDKMASTISAIDRLTSGSAVDATMNQLSSLNHLFDDMGLEESISSSQLEGAVTTTKVALKMLELGREPRTESEMMIARNHEMMHMLPQFIHNDLAPELITEIHRAATLGINNDHYKPGELRENNDVCVKDVETQEIVHQPIDCQFLQDALENLCEWVNHPHHKEQGPDYIHPVVKACILHFMIGWLHPFNDGNGRTARGLFYWYMLKMGYRGFQYISISKYLKNSARAYGYAYLNTEYDNFNLTYFIQYNLEQIHKAIRDYTKHIDDQRELIKFLQEDLLLSVSFRSLNVRQQRMLLTGMLRGGETVTITSMSKKFGVAYNTAKADLEQLKTLGVFKESPMKGDRAFVAPKSVAQYRRWVGDRGLGLLMNDANW